MKQTFLQVGIVGKLPQRDIVVYGCHSCKAKCLTCESYIRGVGMQATTDWILVYEEIRQTI